MITQANAYWLDFFLKRDCNVLIYNYRGYGSSEQYLWTPNLSPDQHKFDAERVMQFLVNRIQVKGKIGCYGRSIGGIAAAHLVGKFPFVSVMIGDRTMGKLNRVVYERYNQNPYILAIYRYISCFWQVDTGKALCNNKNCYKIICFDE